MALPYIGDEAHSWAKDLFPICRSVTGDGVRQTLKYLQKLFPQLTLIEIPSGEVFFDWKVPDEWNVTEAWIETSDGVRVLDFKNNNLHVVGYSEPVDVWLSLEQLETKLHSRPDLPEAIPYISSVYERTWGFCIAEKDRKKLCQGLYHCVIRSKLSKGSMTMAEAILPGISSKEVLISTYADHPSMANNELSGPIVATAIGRWLSTLNNYYTYRILIAPETIGAIVNLAKYINVLKEKMVAGFVLTCIGDERATSVVHTPFKDTYADRVANHVLKFTQGTIHHYDFLRRGSDERQFCAPGVRLPIVTLCRSKFGEFPEYHTSLDDLSKVVTQEGLQGGFSYVARCVEVIELNGWWRSTCLGEPQMGRRGLYPTTMSHELPAETLHVMDVLAYLDGTNDLLSVAELVGLPLKYCRNIVNMLESNKLVERLDSKI